MIAPTPPAPQKYRKKPVVIEAWQLIGRYNFGTVAAWVNDNGGDAQINMFSGVSDFMVIETLEGDMRAESGDWIIRGVKGEFYPCKDSIFRETYDPA